MYQFNFNNVHSTWQPLVKEALTCVEPEYLALISKEHNWFPGPAKIFNAFSLPRTETRFILFGESPYPRQQSANGYAFWDAAITELWSPDGLSKAVNRTTSLRNLMKMLLVATGDLSPDDVSQEKIAAVNKDSYITTVDELFDNLQHRGFLLLNASLVFRKNFLRQDAKAWLPFIEKLLGLLSEQFNTIELVLLGKIAQTIMQLPSACAFKQICAEHPYNISFIHNQNMINFFKPFRLLERTNVSTNH